MLVGVVELSKYALLPPFVIRSLLPSAKAKLTVRRQESKRADKIDLNPD
jgi:hypothetical protein